MKLSTQFLAVYMVTFFCSLSLAVTSFVSLLQPATAQITPDVSGFFLLVFLLSSASTLASVGMMYIHEIMVDKEKSDAG